MGSSAETCMESRAKPYMVDRGPVARDQQQRPRPWLLCGCMDGGCVLAGARRRRKTRAGVAAGAQAGMHGAQGRQGPGLSVMKILWKVYT